jgi:hypothetical protein
MLEPALREVGIGVLATYVTEHSENTFPSLPVREDKDVFVWMSLFEDETEHARRLRTLERSSAWRDVSQVLARHLAGAEELLRLVPTARSAIQG